MSVHREGKKGVYYMSFYFHNQKIHRSTGMYKKGDAEEIERQLRIKLEKEYRLAPELRLRDLKLSEAIKLTYKVRWFKKTDGLATSNRCKKIVKALNDKNISELRTGDIIHLRDKLMEEGLKGSTVNRYYAYLKTIMRVCMKQGDVRMPNPAPDFDFFDETPGRLRTVSKSEEKDILKAMREQGYPDMCDLIIVLIDVGARLSNIIKLDKNDIDFETGFIHFWKNKGKKVGYKVPMTPRVKEILEKRTKKSSRPFMLTINQVEKAWTKIKVKLKLTGDKEFVLHSLRHTFCSRLANKNVDIYTIKNLAGHKNIKTTERYCHETEETLKKAIQKIV